MDIGKVVREIRKEKGISQEKLALEADISRRYVYLLESGQCSPTIKILEKIANALHVKIYDIVYRADI